MATVTVYAVYDPGKTLTADFYPIVGDTATLTDQTMTELSNGDGVYTCSATATWSDLSTYRMHIKEGGVPRAVFEVYFSGGTTARAVPFGLAYVYAYMAKVLYDNLDTITGSDGVTLATAQSNYAPAKAGDQMALVNDAITASKYDESTAFPLKSADAGSTAVSRFDSTSDTVDVGKINGSSKAARVQGRLGDAAIELTVDDATFTPTTTTFETDGTITADDTLIGMAGTWYNSSGDPANDVTYFVTASEGTTTNSNNKLKLTVETLPAAPADGDIFVVLGAKVK